MMGRVTLPDKTHKFKSYKHTNTQEHIHEHTNNPD